MAGYFCTVKAVALESGRLQVAYEQRNGTLASSILVDTGKIGYDMTSFTGTASQKLAALKAALDETFARNNASYTEGETRLASARTALVGFTVPAAP